MPKRSAFDAERLRQVLRAQHHVITRQQALLCGLPPSTLDRYIAPSGRWQRLLPGVYLALTGAATQDQLEMAALLYAGPRSLITGSAAVRRHQRHDRLLAHGIMPLHFPPKRIKADPSASSTTSGQRSSRDRVGRRCPSPRSRLTSGAVPRVRAVPPVSRRPPGSALCPADGALWVRHKVGACAGKCRDKAAFQRAIGPNPPLPPIRADSNIQDKSLDARLISCHVLP